MGNDQPTMIRNDHIEKTRKLMETNEKNKKMDGNERNRGDLRIHMKLQQIETNMQEMRKKRTETHKNREKPIKMTKNERCNGKQRKAHE